MRRGLAAVAVLLLVLLTETGCGRYGPPVRSAGRPRAASQPAAVAETTDARPAAAPDAPADERDPESESGSGSGSQ